MVDIDGAGEVRVSSRKAHPSKLTRITTLGALWVLCGPELESYLSAYRANPMAKQIVRLRESGTPSAP